MSEPFLRAINLAGLTAPLTAIADGQIHRFSHKDDKSKQNCWYVLHESADFSAGAFGCWKRNISEVWNSCDPAKLTQAQRDEWRQRQAEIAAKVESERKAKQQEAAKRAASVWSIARPDIDLNHGYLVAKGGLYPYCAKQLKDSLVIPLYGQDKQIAGCQFIYPNGDKKFLTGTKKKGSFCCLKPRDFNINDVPIVYIVEGWGNGLTIFTAMDSLVFVAFDCGNLLAVAEFVRSKYPLARIVICADIEPHHTGIKAAREAAKAVNGVAAIPQGETDEKGKLDFNDIYRKHGLSEVKKMVEDILISEIEAPSQSGTTDTGEKASTFESTESVSGEEPKKKPVLRVVSIAELVLMKLPPRENLLAPWLPKQGLAMVYAPRGIGKTFFALNVAYAVASGGEFLGWQADTANRVLYIDGEMPVSTMQERLHGIIKSHKTDAGAESIQILTPDLQKDIGTPDLSTVEGQAAIEPFLEGITLIVIDNISTLCRSGRENEADGWITVQEWALRQRAAGRSILFVHHAGKGGNQRGTSKREDVLDTVINLKRPIDYSPADGASFEVHFEKARGFSGDAAEPLACRLVSDENNLPAWAYSRLEDSTFDKVVSLFDEGLTQKDIAEELQIDKSSVSKHLKKAREQGLIKMTSVNKNNVNSANYAKAKNGEAASWD